MEKLIYFPLLIEALGNLVVRCLWLEERVHACFQKIMSRNMTICLGFSCTYHTLAEWAEYNSFLHSSCESSVSFLSFWPPFREMETQHDLFLTMWERKVKQPTKERRKCHLKMCPEARMTKFSVFRIACNFQFFLWSNFDIQKMLMSWLDIYMCIVAVH